VRSDITAVLDRGTGERERRPADVIEQVAERVRRARRRGVEQLVGNAPDEIGQSTRRRFEVDGHQRRSG
jgi:hypothetical protein